MQPVCIRSLFIFVLFQLWIAMFKNFSTMLAFQFLMGLFGLPALCGLWQGLVYVIGCFDGGHLTYASVRVLHWHLAIRHNSRVSTYSHTPHEYLLNMIFQTNNRCLPYTTLKKRTINLQPIISQLLGFFPLRSRAGNGDRKAHV